MIIVENLRKNFEDFTAVDGISFSVKAGEVLALLGPNGAGKTTTARMLTSILRPSEGRASVAGHDVVANPEAVRASVGVLTENHGLYARMPAVEYLHFFGELYGMPIALRAERIDFLLTRFGLADARQRRIGEYSKGMRQKLALARALLHNPPVLLLDEPTSAMDPESARLVRDAIQELRSAERAIIICTHNLAEAEELADQIAIIRRGKIIARGTPLDLKQQLLGVGEFEIRLAATLNGNLVNIPPGMQISAQGAKWLRFRTRQPEQDNPKILKALLAQNLPVIGLQEVPRSLEQVYLQAVSAPEGVEVSYAA